MAPRFIRTRSGHQPEASSTAHGHHGCLFSISRADERIWTSASPSASQRPGVRKTSVSAARRNRRHLPVVDSLDGRVLLSSTYSLVDGTLYRQLSGGGEQEVDTGVESFGVTSLGVVYELNQEQGGVLLDSGTGNPGSFEQIAPGNTRSFAMSPSGAAYALGLNGVLSYDSGPAGGNCTHVADSGVVSFAFAPDGTRYDLGSSGTLWRKSPGSGFQQVDTGVECFGVTSLGVVYELNQEQGGVLLDSGSGNPGSFEQIGPGNTLAFAMSPSGAAYALGVDGVLRYDSGPTGGNCTQIADSDVVSFAFAPDGTRYELGDGGTLWRQAPGAASSKWTLAWNPSGSRPWVWFTS